MPSVQIKNVPEDVHKVLRTRAAAAGQSLQEYLLARLVADASEEPLDDVLARLSMQSGGALSLADAAEAVRADRNAH